METYGPEILKAEIGNLYTLINGANRCIRNLRVADVPAFSAFYVGMCRSSNMFDETLCESYVDFELELDSVNHIKTITEKCNEGTRISFEPNTLVTQDQKQRRLKPWFIQVIKPDSDGDNLLFLAIILGKSKIAMLLIDLIPDYIWLSRHNRMLQTALHIATLTNNCELVRRLVVAGIDVKKQDLNGNTALHIACLKSFRDIAEALLTPVKYSETKLNSYEIPYQAIPQNLDIRNFEGLTCFLLATINGDRYIMEMLIDNEADINSFDTKSGKTCLHILAEYGDSILTKYILSKPRINVNAKTYSGYTALQIANYRSHDQVVYLLRCAGADEVVSDDEYVSS